LGDIWKRSIAPVHEGQFDRRELLKSALAGTLAMGFPSLLRAQADKLTVIDGGGTNVVVFPSADGVILVDSGAPKSGDTLRAALGSNAKVQILFNTHYHLDQTASNEMFAAAGAKIIAHEHTRQWMSTDYWVPDEDRYEKARPSDDQPAKRRESQRHLGVIGDAKHREIP